MMAVGMVLSAAGTIGVIGFLVDRWADLSRMDVSASIVTAMVGALLFYIGALAAMCCGWTLTLRSVGSRVAWDIGATTFLIGQFAKYAPGNVLQHVSRFALTRAAGVGAPQTIAALAMEMVLAIVPLALIAVGGLIVNPGPFTFETIGHHGLASVAIAVTAVILALIVLLGVWHVRERFRGAFTLRALSPGPAIGALACYIGHAAAMCLLPVALISALPGGPSVSLALASAYAVAWIAGFLTPGAPAGLGIRDGALLVLMAPTIGAEAAGAVVIGQRAITIFGDVLGLFVGLAWRRWTLRRPGPESSNRVNQ